MLGEIATTILYLGTIGIGIFGIGFCTPKYFIYGGIATGIGWPGAPIARNFTRTDAEAILPHLLDLWTVFPRAINKAMISTETEYGFLGAVITIILGIIFAIPYLIGCYLGIRYYPELTMLRLVI